MHNKAKHWFRAVSPLSFLGLGLLVFALFVDNLLNSLSPGIAEETFLQFSFFKYLFLVSGLALIIQPLLSGLIRRKFNKRNNDRNPSLLKYGVKATATLLEIQRTGVIVNQMPQYRFKIKVISVEGKEVVITRNKVIDFPDRPKLQEGMQLPALMDADNPPKVLLFWEEAGINTAL